MAKLTKWGKVGRFEERLKGIREDYDTEIKRSPTEIAARRDKRIREAIAALDTETAEAVVKQGLITASELSAATAPEKAEPAPAAEEQGGKAKAR